MSASAAADVHKSACMRAATKLPEAADRAETVPILDAHIKTHALKKAVGDLRQPAMRKKKNEKKE
jgi:hypothetical protein